MVELEFPKYPLRFKSRENKRLVFDFVRKKYVLLQPEEWVRQHCLHYLVKDKGYPAGRMLVERELLVSGLRKRVDIAVCNPQGGNRSAGGVQSAFRGHYPGGVRPNCPLQYAGKSAIPDGNQRVAAYFLPDGLRQPTVRLPQGAPPLHAPREYLRIPFFLVTLSALNFSGLPLTQAANSECSQ